MTNLPRPRDDLGVGAQKGGLVKFKNGMIGEIISTNGSGMYERIEVMVDGTRCYTERGDVEVLGVLDRIAREI